MAKKSRPIYPGIKVQLTGRDGNAFSVLGNCKRAMQRAGCDKDEIDEFWEEATSGDYDNALATAMKYFDVE